MTRDELNQYFWRHTAYGTEYQGQPETKRREAPLVRWKRRKTAGRGSLGRKEADEYPPPEALLGEAFPADWIELSQGTTRYIRAYIFSRPRPCDLCHNRLRPSDCVKYGDKRRFLANFSV